MLFGGVTKWLDWSKTRKTLVAPLPGELSGNLRMSRLANCYNVCVRLTPSGGGAEFLVNWASDG